MAGQGSKFRWAALIGVGGLWLHGAQAASFVVQSVRVEGLQNLSHETVLNATSVRVGKPFDPNQSGALIKGLYDTGWFESVDVAREGGQLVLRIKERPLVGELSVTGSRDKDKLEKMLKKKLGLGPGRSYDEGVLVEARDLILQYYHTKGRFNVQVESRVSVLDPNRRLDRITLNVFEGPIARIKRIDFIGHHAFKSGTLRSQFDISRPGLFSFITGSGQYTRLKLDLDLESLRSFYLDRGYADFLVENTEVTLSEDKRSVYVKIFLKEGPLFRFGQVSLRGDLVVAEEKLRASTKWITAGSSFSRQRVNEVKARLEELLGAEGYSAALITPVLEMDRENHVIDVAFEVNPNGKIYVRRIEITGNDTSEDVVFRRELAQMERAWVSPSLIRESKDNLLRTGYVKEVNVEMQPVPGHPEWVDVRYAVVEEKVREFSAGLGFSTQERLMFNVGVKQKNFLGTGRDIDFAFNTSKTSSLYRLDYLNPYFTLDKVGLGGSLFYEKTDLARATAVSDYSTESLGGSLRWVLPLSRYEHFHLGTGYERTRLFAAAYGQAEEIRSFLSRHGNRYNEYYGTLGWGYDSLDRPLFPSRGLSHAWAVKWAFPNSSLRYYRATYDASWYQPLWREPWILNVAAGVGYGSGYGKTGALPFLKHFYTGGVYTVRGFEENSLGPKDSRGQAYGGDCLVRATMAVIVPTPFAADSKTLRTSLFVDGGQVYSTKYKRRPLPDGTFMNRNPNGLRYAYGVSLEWNTPLGTPVMISLAKPFQKRRGDEYRVLGIAMGTRF